MIVREFVKHLNVNAKGHYVYALCTAGDNIGETMDLLRHDLEARGVELNAAFSLIMPESYLGLPFSTWTTRRRRKKRRKRLPRN